MAHGVPNRSNLSDARIQELLESLDRLIGGHQAGFRPVHAKGILCSGTFTPTEHAKTLTKAPHANQPSTPVIVRFSNASGMPMVPDNDPNGGGPRGMAIRWDLGDHAHTDVVCHSVDGFPTRTADEFLDLLKAILTSGPDVPVPKPVDTFLASHPAALKFVTTPKPFPASFANETFYGVHAFKFTNAAGVSRYGRLRIRPHANSDYLSDEAAKAKGPGYLADELSARLAAGPARWQLKIQLAEPGDNLNDATVRWPESRQELDFGTVTVIKREDSEAPDLKRIIFDPVPRIDGIDPSDDPLIEVRAAIYLLSGRRRRMTGASPVNPTAVVS